jgi:hypothetical protein
VDWHRVDADPDPAFHFDPDPALNFQMFEIRNIFRFLFTEVPVYIIITFS